jgi:hypothetical protein
MIGFFKKLFTGAAAPARAAASIEYEGFEVIAMPRAVKGGWSTEGVIRKHVDGEVREVAFIRADTCMSENDAVATAQNKARKIIDERGDKVFDSARA